MAFTYLCKSCNKTTTFDTKIGPAEHQNCATCKSPLNTKNLTYDPNPYKHAKFAEDIHAKRATSVNAARGIRSLSAPKQTDADTLPTACPNGIIYVEDLATNAWTSATAMGRIRLAYKGLVSAPKTGNGTQGMVIDPGIQLLGASLLHFQRIATFMQANHTDTDATEATGEAAAALAMLKGGKFSGYTMVWGLHLHSGAGIDQIWEKTSGGIKEYVIVEAKGPGQSLRVDKFAPVNIGSQMSKEWVIDRLGHMTHALGAQILKDIGVTVGITHPNYGGASKSYYGATAVARNANSAKLRGIVITAKWSGLSLQYTYSGDQMYYS